MNKSKVSNFIQSSMLYVSHAIGAAGDHPIVDDLRDVMEQLQSSDPRAVAWSLKPSCTSVGQT